MNTIAISFVVYTLAILAIGVYSARFSKPGSADFFLAGRTLGPWVAALSSSASAESGWVTLGLVGTAFTLGAGALWIIPGSVLAFLFNWLIIGGRLRRLAAAENAVTLPDILATRCTGTVAVCIRLFAIVIIVTMLTAYVAAQLNAAGKTCAATFESPYINGVLTGAVIVLTYTVTGGFRAVAWTDVIQALFMIGALLILPVVLIVHLGGPAETWARLGALEGGAQLTDGFAGKSGLALLGFLAVWLGIPLGNPGQPHILVRFMATRDDAAIRRGATIATAWVFLLFSGAVILDPKTHRPVAEGAVSLRLSDLRGRVRKTLARARQ